MSEPNSKTEGKRMAPKQKGAKGPLIAVVCILAVLVAAYAGLCFWAGAHTLPNSSFLGMDMSSMTEAEARAVIAQAPESLPRKIALTYANTVLTFEGDKVGLAVDADAALACVTVNRKPFLQRGAAWLQGLSQTHEVDPSLLQFKDKTYLDGLLTDVNTQLSNPVEQHQVRTDLDRGLITITKGRTGQAMDTATVEAALLNKLIAKDTSPLPLTAVFTEPEPINFDQLYEDIYIEPVNAALDGETHQIVPSVTGVSFAVGTARAQFGALDPGEMTDIPLIFTQPEITTQIMEEKLFADNLGKAYSWVSGSENRLANVTLAADFCRDTILLPGEEFSYWSKIDPCTVEQGFKPAPSYLNGKTVDSIGGGICQVSSSIYAACLLANLEIVQRNQHTYAVGYLPEGSDAMVNGGSSDFKFKNNTEWPIKIEIILKGRNLYVNIWGTKTDDTYVEMEFNNTSSTPWQTVYKIDNSIPAGSPKEEVTPYTGYKNETYRCVYAGDGTLISRTLESKNNYRKRDKVILINAADAAQYNVDPVTGEKLPEPAPTPETPAPSADPGTPPEWLGITTTPEPQVTPIPTPEPTPYNPLEDYPPWLLP